MEERIFIKRLQQGDEAAFRELVEQFQDRVYNTVLGFLKLPRQAEDVAQEVFIEVYQSIKTFKGDARLATWIYRIAVNKSLEALRYKKRKKRFAPLRSLFDSAGQTAFEIPDTVHPGIIAENQERARILSGAIDKLPQNQQIAFTLHKIEGLKYQEIADIMELSKSSVESLMHRAKKNLQKLLYTYYQQQML